MIYDHIIIGGGVAGSVCAFQLKRKGKNCIILEKNNPKTEKVCGGGISYKALSMLNEIGINTNLLFKLDSKKVTGHTFHQNNECLEKVYTEGKISLGMQRHLFDNFLVNNSLQNGIVIKYNERVKEIQKCKDIYNVNGFFSRDIVWASGARRISGKLLKEQSIGISGQIYARSNLPDNIFHYWYFDDLNPKKYFWAFPIGYSLWNVGVWNRNYYKELNRDYQNCVLTYFLNTTMGQWKYTRNPRAEFLGHNDQRESEKFMQNGIGDFAGHCNPVNGGGITPAIKSAIQYAAHIK